MTDIGEFKVKTIAECRDDILRVIRNGLLRRGIEEPNVTPGSDYFVLAESVASEIAVISANQQIKADELMPDTAPTIERLQRIGDFIVGAPRDAAGSNGYVVFSSSASSLITTGTQLQDGAGLRYQVTIGGTYADGAIVPVSSIDVGTETNLSAADTLRWVTTPSYSDPTALAYADFRDGVDSEDIETYRTRVIEGFRNPPAGGNWSHVATLAEKSHPSVQKAFVYPALQGPGTTHVAVTGYTSSSSKDRDVSTTLVTNEIYPYVIGNLSEHGYYKFTTVANVNVDVSIGLALPSAPTASPPGPGGGWVDGSPWPRNVLDADPFKCSVTSVTSDTVFTVDAPSIPTINVSRISWINRNSKWVVQSALVVAVTGTTGAYVITLDSPFPGVAVGDYIWPKCTNQDVYVAALLKAFAGMGPGEKTANTTILERGYRHPIPSLSWPSSLNTSILKKIEDTGDEVEDTMYLYRSTTTPALPATVNDPPNILVPRNLAFYPINP